MVNALEYWVRQSVGALTPNLGWMVWNTFLALIPLGLSGWLFSVRTAAISAVVVGVGDLYRVLAQCALCAH
jgi:uncharacterized membrane protein